MIKKLILSVASVILVSTLPAHAAAPKKFPNGCREVGFEFKDGKLILNPVSEEGEIQTVYLVHNNSDNAVKFESEKLPGQVFAPNYKHTIDSNLWSSFSLGDPRVQFVCKSDDATVNCNDVVEVCQYTRAKFASHNGGTYWIKKSETQSQAVRSIISNGVLLRW